MKKLGVTIVLYGCKKEKPDSEDLKTEISVKRPKAFPCESGSYNISYTIENPREGVELEINSEDAWITHLNVSEKEISFNLSKNELTEERRGSIEFSYKGAKSVNVTIIQEGISADALDINGTANCYIVSSPGVYKFPAVRGNSDKLAGPVSKADVLWETFGTSTAPEKGNLISVISYNNNDIIFKTADDFKKGNALIAAMDENGKILWSWHIWLTDQPEDQEYLNNAGTMMDRNLGATSATPGDVGALGLLYQWGRKDPFLGASSIEGGQEAKSTTEFTRIQSDASTGTIQYTIANPTTFITSEERDWYYFEKTDSEDNSRWKRDKTIYDPCPPGYRIPDGGGDGIWAKAWDSADLQHTSYDATNMGCNFSSSKGSNAFSDVDNCWYPKIGMLDMSGILKLPSTITWYWASGTMAGSTLLFTPTQVGFKFAQMPVSGNPVRCQKE